MFDFFKDAYVELSGLDREKVEEERKAKKKNDGLFKRSTRSIITVVGLLYLVIAGLNIYNIILAGIEFRIVKYFLLSIIDLFVLVTMQIKKKEMDRLALIGLIIFMGCSFLLTNF